MSTDKNISEKPKQEYVMSDAEKERLLKDMNRSDVEKFKLFTQMLRRNALYKKAKITHK